MKGSLKIKEIKHKNKTVESTQLMDHLGTTCGPPIDKHWSNVYC
jgi:hypothetical protein